MSLMCVSVCHSNEAVTSKPSQSVTSPNTDHSVVNSRPPQFGRRKSSTEMQRPVIFGSAAGGYEPKSATTPSRLSICHLFGWLVDWSSVALAQLFTAVTGYLLDIVVNYTDKLVLDKNLLLIVTDYHTMCTKKHPLLFSYIASGKVNKFEISAIMSERMVIRQSTLFVYFIENVFSH